MKIYKRTDKRWGKVALIAILMLMAFQSCVPTRTVREENTILPDSYQKATDTLNTADMQWRAFFSDTNLVQLIDTALTNNQELNIMLQQVTMAQNEIQARKGEYLPFVQLSAGAEVEKVGEFTRNGAVEENLTIRDGERFPEPLGNYGAALSASWELDIWKRLRNAKKSAVFEYLASVEGKNFMVTNLVSEIADAYYELVALDNQLIIIEENLAIQENALGMVRLQKQAARVTELAVRRFEAEVLKNRSHRFEIQQQIVETENRINFLLGRTPRPIQRNAADFVALSMDTVYAGIPAELLQNRPDIRRAELELASAKLNTKVAKANFYPTLGIRGGIGLEAFNPKFLTETPASLLYSLAGDVVGPLINRNAIKATYNTANNRQLQAVYEYERAILNGYMEVANQLSNVQNLQKNYALKEGQVAALTASIEISLLLFQSARADYMEVLLVQREALESRIELVETKKAQMAARINMYQALGGGWN